MNTFSKNRAIPIVAGVGNTSFGKHPSSSCLDLGQWALREALDDCGLTHECIDSLIVSRIPEYGELARRCGIDPRRVYANPGHGRFAGASIQTAEWLVTTGQAKTVALVYANDSQSQGNTYGGNKAGYGGAAGAYGSGDDLWAPYGMTSPGAFHALMLQRHSYLYGTSPEATGEIATTFRRNATLNPTALMREPLSLDSYLDSKFICDPLRLYDYCRISDGAVAMIITHSQRAQELKKAPIYIKGSGQASCFQNGDFPPDDFWYTAMQKVAKEASDSSGLTPHDMDGLMIYDNFTPTVLFTLEGFGFCSVGSVDPWVREGHLRLDGDFPTNTNGGHLSEAYMQGWSLNVEAVRQLRGECGSRQIKGAENIQYMAASPIVTSIIYGVEP